MEFNKKAIAIVSFGTTYMESSEKTIKAITDEVSKTFNDYYITEAYTSSIVRDTLASKGIVILSPEECLNSLLEEGFKEVIVLPTHIVGGEEYNKVSVCVERLKDKFETISMCRPLIEEQDIVNTVNLLLENIDFSDDQYLLLMGHGSPTEANKVYHLLNDEISSRGIDNMYISTVEATPDIENAIHKVKEYDPKEVILTPFMLVSGDHANNDMAIDWKRRLNEIGYTQVKCIMKGLGEYPQFRKVYVDRVREVIC